MLLPVAIGLESATTLASILALSFVRGGGAHAALACGAGLAAASGT
jgi:hypothetical protein